MLPSISVDWLQLYCDAPMKKIKFGKFVNNVPSIISNSERLEVVKLDYPTRQFREVYEIKMDKEVCAIITAAPHESSVLDPNCCIVKIHNKFLYQKDLKAFTVFLLQDLNIVFKIVSRLDISVDFLQFDNGWTGEVLIKKFVNEELIKAGRKVKWALQGDTGKNDEETTFLNFQYLRFGKKGGDIAYYLYNKSEELRQVKEKPYIREFWAANGYKEEMGDVWRMEFSLKGNKYGVVNNDDGETVTMASLNILEDENIVKWFKNYFDRHFRFYANNGKNRKDRNQIIELFKDIKPDTIRIELSKKKDSGKSQRTFAKQLNELNKELRNDVPTLGMMADDLLRFYVQQYSLESYATKRLGLKELQPQNDIWEKYYEAKSIMKQEENTNNLLEWIYQTTLFTNEKANHEQLTLWGLNLTNNQNIF